VLPNLATKGSHFVGGNEKVKEETIKQVTKPKGVD